MDYSEKVVTLKLTCAAAIDGRIVRAGTLVEVVESEAKDLLRRGKAEIHAAPEKTPKAPEVAPDQAAASQAAVDAAKQAGTVKAATTGR